MKLIKPSVEYILQEEAKIPYKHIELCARTCYSEDTEVLTDSGWKFFPQVLETDKVLTYNPDTNKLLWDNSNVVCREIKDSMIEVSHANIKLCVTKDHRIYQSVPERREYNFITASQMAGLNRIPHSKQTRFRIPKYFIGSKRDESCISIPKISYCTTVNIGHGKTKEKSIEFEVTKDFMVIAGAYISEGHTNNHLKYGSGSTCQITQTEGTSLYNNVIEALNNLGWQYRIGKDPRKPQIKWIIFGEGILWVRLFDELFGKGSKNKHLPKWFRQLPDEYLQIMLTNMYLGDGSHTTTRKERYLSISQRLLEEVQEVFVLLGKNASFTYDTNMNQKCSCEESTRDSWIIDRKKHIRILPVAERRVYCTSTNSGIIQIRYKGKTCWCGNCYKSEDKITVDSAKKFVEGLIMAGHTAMLEHGTVYLEKTFKKFEDNKYRNNPYSANIGGPEKTEDGIVWKWYITTNFRVLVENDWLDDLQYAFNPTEYHKKRYTMKFVTDIGVCRELLRHRVFSFANESTRYCNYSKDKFSNEITFIVPYWYTYSNGSNDLECSMDSEFENCCRDSEQSYLRMIRWGAKPQEARQILPLATKTELVMTGFEDDWRHFFDLRLRGTTGKPHPDMLAVAQLAWNEFKDKLNLEL